MSSPKILCLSFDKAVSDLRCKTLTDAGFEVHSTVDLDEAMRLLKPEAFAAVVIGHRFSKPERRILARQAIEISRIPVILVISSAADTDITANAYVSTLEGSEGIVRAVAGLVPMAEVRPS